MSTLVDYIKQELNNTKLRKAFVWQTHNKPINKDSIRNLMSRFELCFLFTPCNKRTTLNGRFIKLPNP